MAKPKPRAKERRVEQAIPLSQLFAVSRRYRRSIHVERDDLSLEALDGYQLTPVALKTLDRIISGLRDERGTRAWSLTGPYGSGKSSFAVYLAALFSAGETARATDGRALASVAKKLIRDVSHDRHEDLFGASGRRKLPMLRSVLITAERQPLPALLLRGLSSGLHRIWSGRKSRPKVIARIDEQAELAESGRTVSTRTVVRLFEEAREAIRRADLGDGLLVVVDEAGKALEHAAQSPRASDVLLLQELAELAARSAGAPFVFLTVFHQSFSGYAARLSPAQRNEWEKVQGRFEDIAFVDGWEQTVRFVSEAIERRGGIPDRALSEATDEVQAALRCADLPAALARPEVRNRLIEGLPLHPYVTLLLGPLFRSGIFQNERSLFAFLVSREPGALQEFLGKHNALSSHLPLYTIDALYHYVTNVLDSRGSYGRGQALQTAEVALGRVPDAAGELGRAVVKTVALISWLGEKVGLRASLETLAQALPGKVSVKTLREVIAALTDASILTYRRFRSSYVLWEGSDIRIDDVLQKAQTRSLSPGQAARLLDAVTEQNHLVARRHLFETGTLRYFPVSYVASDDMRDRLLADSNDGDGEVLIAITRNEVEQDHVIKLIKAETAIARSETQRPIIVVVPHDSERLMDLVAEHATLEALPELEPGLQGDPVARREVAARAEDVKALLRAEVAEIIGSGSGSTTSRWFVFGKEHPVRHAREISALLSDVCDRAYDKAAFIHNELLNRAELSAASAAARRELLARMLEASDKESFGIEGFPPEMSMYQSLFNKHRLHHRQKHGPWGLDEPPVVNAKAKTKRGHLSFVWHAMTEFLAAHEGERVALTDLYAHLERPPYGLKRGVSPVLFIHYYAINAESIALYESDRFQPSMTPAVAERMLRATKNFSLQWHPIADTRAEVLLVLGEALGVEPRPGREAPTLLQIIKQLVRVANDLTHYARYTKQLAEPTLRVRDALMSAKEPAPLLFRTLPQAVGVEPFESKDKRRSDDARVFAQALKKAVTELERAYEVLLRKLESTISTTFGIGKVKDGDLRRKLAGRGTRVLPHAVAPKLRSFLMRALDESMPRDEWIVNLATLFANKPPEHWADSDRNVFDTELAIVQRSFAEMEALVLATEELPDLEDRDTGERVLRVSVSELGAPRRERVVTLSPQDSRAADRLRDEIQGSLNEFRSELTADARLAILSAMAAQLMTEIERAGKRPGTISRAEGKGE